MIEDYVGIVERNSEAPTTPAETRTIFLFFTTGETSEMQETVEKTKTCNPTIRARPPDLAWVVNLKMIEAMFGGNLFNIVAKR